MKRHSLFIGSAVMAWLAGAAMRVEAQEIYPQCIITSSATSVSFGNVSVPRNLPIGANIGPRRSTYGRYRCAAYSLEMDGNSVAGFYLQLTSALDLAPGHTDVWATGTPGVGVRVTSAYFNNRSMSSIGAGLQQHFAPDITTETLVSRSYILHYQLVKTGEMTQAGPASVAKMFDLQSHNRGANLKSDPLVSIGIANTTIAFNACRVTTPSINVALPAVSLSGLRTTGSIAGETPFSIGLACPAGINVYATLTDATTPGNRTDRLTLTSTSTARNVGLRVVDASGSPVRFGPDTATAGNTNAWFVGASGSTRSMPLRVQYIATGTVTPGSVQGLMTFTMSYQ
nr:fimbrial protein [uncultured Cupriavidus sp.]